MNILSLTGIEFNKIRRSKIILILLTAAVILWIPSILNADLNFAMQDIGITPENNFLIQGFLGMAWFMYPASMVVSTVLLTQTERSNKGILKMLSLPVSTSKLCSAKFIVLLVLAALQIFMITGIYFASAAIAGQIQHYNFMLPPLFVLKEAVYIYLSSIPMLAFFWMLSVCIQTPIFSVGIGLASIVPSVLIINTKAWWVYPMAYPFYVITAEYGKLASHLSTCETALVPWIPLAIIFTCFCFMITCLSFGQHERR